jgi:hypothetical protein
MRDKNNGNLIPIGHTNGSGKKEDGIQKRTAPLLTLINAKTPSFTLGE